MVMGNDARAEVKNPDMRSVRRDNLPAAGSDGYSLFSVPGVREQGVCGLMAVGMVDANGLKETFKKMAGTHAEGLEIGLLGCLSRILESYTDNKVAVKNVITAVKAYAEVKNAGKMSELEIALDRLDRIRAVLDGLDGEDINPTIHVQLLKILDDNGPEDMPYR